MARSYPRFLFSNPTDTKSEGPFIVHTLEPHFIVKPLFDEKRNIIDCRVLDIWSGSHYSEVYKIMEDIPTWFKHSGILHSSHDDDKLITLVGKLSFLKDYKTHFTVEEARALIKVLFPTKAKKIYERSGSYGLKHLFEHVSETIINNRFGTHKYCSNNVVIQAFEEEGFKYLQEGPNRCMNLSIKEVNRAYRLFWNH